MRWGSLLTLLVVSAVACGSSSASDAHLPVIPAPTAEASTWFGANRVELLTDGAAAASRMRDLLLGARWSIEAEIYEFNRPDLADALVGAARRGLTVTLVEDPTVGVNGGTAARLRQAGAEVLDFPVQ